MKKNRGSSQIKKMNFKKYDIGQQSVLIDSIINGIDIKPFLNP